MTPTKVPPVKIPRLSIAGLLGIALLSWVAQVYAQPPVPIDLQTGGPSTIPVVAFTKATQAWLQTRIPVRVAVWTGAVLPLQTGYDPSKFEGLAAQYLDLIRKATGLQLQILRYGSRTQARQALESGQVDMLAVHDTSEGQVGAYSQSRPYLLNRKVIVQRIGETQRFLDLRGKRLAYVGDDAIGAQLHRRYPDATLLQHSDTLNALASVMYGQADAVWTDAIAAQFIIRQRYSNELYIVADASVGSADINFAVSDRYPQLLAAINQTLDAMPIDDMTRITTRWGLSPNFVARPMPLDLSTEESAWIKAHPTLKVLVVGSYAPLTFFDDDGQLMGLTADILNIVARRTGLKLEVINSAGVGTMLEQLEDHKANLIAALDISPDHLRPEQYTRPYLISPFVVVTRRTEGDIQTVDTLNGKRLAIPAGNPLSGWLSQQYPQITQVPVTNAIRGMEMLSEGDVDGSIHNQIAADYFVKHHFQSALHIGSVIGQSPAYVAMAVATNDRPLKTIINKVLLDISPEELKSLIDRWRNHAAPVVASPWNTYKDDVYTVLTGAAVLLLLFAMWVYYLQVQIRKRHRAEQALGDQLSFSHTLIDGSPIALYVRDKQGLLLQCNRAYLKFLTTTTEAVLGKSLVDSGVVSVATAETFQQLYRDTRDHDTAYYGDIEVNIGGKDLHIHHWALPYHNLAGEFAGVIGGWQDISEREQLMEQLQIAKETADEANASKTVFLASMSHEIRTPISALIGLIEMLRISGPTAQQIDENLTVAHQSAQSLLALVGDILDLSKIEAGAMEPVQRQTALDEVVESVHKLFEINAHNKHLKFELVIDVQNPDVLIDALMLNQIIANLVSNAIKFTEHGFVKLALVELPDLEDVGNSCYTVAVSDSGSGLDDTQKKAVFEPFVQVRPHPAGGRGTGLGLSICTRLANLLGAQLSVESVLGAGSCFTLRFCAEHSVVPIDATPPVAGTHYSQRLNVLVVEDHAPNRLLLCQQLEYLGHRVVACDDGQAAFAEWLRAVPRFDLTITDCNMPVMDGYELTRKMRSSELDRALPFQPVFGLTANAQQSIVEACLRAGMTQCLFKPIGIEALAEQLGTISVQVERRSKAAATDGGELQKLRVLSPEAYQPLVAELIRSNRADAAMLEDLIHTSDLPRLAGMAHKIRGGAQLADAQMLVAACATLEFAVQTGDGPACRLQVAAILSAMGELEALLLEDL